MESFNKQSGPSFTLPEWLKHRRMSRGHWYRLKAAGEAPDTYGTGRGQRISSEADARWIEEQERKAKRGA
jgi:hypothetical protein